MQKELNWYPVSLRDSTLNVPKQRWGHRIITLNGELYLFGGFGGVPEGEGTYMCDLWKFDLLVCNWSLLTTFGDLPESRSNYTIHYNPVNHTLILFGGGSANKTRYNSVCLLDLATLTWRKITPAEGSQSPWERTYHTAEFAYPYLVVFGGEGGAGIDLDDSWAFNVQTQKWTRLIPNGPAPIRRRFASSTLIGTQFYLIGGCNDNYHLLGEVYRLNLQPLLSGRSQELQWEIVAKSRVLERWGHCSNYYNGKIYIFAGRVSVTTDNSDLLELDPKTGIITELETKGKVPKPRRRHGSALVGDCLLIQGGYNGSYLSDFLFVKLPKTVAKQQSKIQVLQSEQDVSTNVRQVEQTFSNGQFLQLVDCNQTKVTLPTQTNLLSNNQFFKYMLKNQQNTVYLPNFCTIQHFRTIQAAILKGTLYCCKASKITQNFQIAQALQYFCCQDLLPQYETFLISTINPINALTILQLALSHQLLTVAQQAAAEYLKADKTALQSCKSSNLLQDTSMLHLQLGESKSLITILQSTYHKIGFQLQQQLLRGKKSGVLSKTANLLKSLFTFGNYQQPAQQSKGQKSMKRQYAVAAWAYVRRVCRCLPFVG